MILPAAGALTVNRHEIIDYPARAGIGTVDMPHGFLRETVTAQGVETLDFEVIGQ